MEWDEDVEEWPVEAILDKRLATKEDKNAEPGDVMYLVAWEGWGPSFNSWEPYVNIVDDNLIEDYEARADQAEDDGVCEEVEHAEEAAAEEVMAMAQSDVEPAEQPSTREVATTSTPINVVPEVNLSHL